MRLNESRTRSFQAPAAVHSFPGRQVFVFPNGRSDSDESDEEEELNVMELRPRGREQPRGSARDRLGDVVLLERELTEEDSLNKLALQYGCKVRVVIPEGFPERVLWPGSLDTGECFDAVCFMPD